MFILDIVGALFLPEWIGVAFLIFAVLAETGIISKLLYKRLWDNKILMAVGLANVITSVAGMIIFKIIRYPGMVFNWVAFYEYRGDILMEDRTLEVFIQSFLLSIIMEWLVICAFFLRKVSLAQITLATLAANIFTYLAAGGILLFYLKQYQLGNFEFLKFY